MVWNMPERKKETYPDHPESVCGKGHVYPLRNIALDNSRVIQRLLCF